MCMGKTYATKYNKRVVKQMMSKAGYITVYKVAIRGRSIFKPPVYRHRCRKYPPGIHMATLYAWLQESGWHAFRDLASAQAYAKTRGDPYGSPPSMAILRCMALPAWVINCGTAYIGKPGVKMNPILLTHLCFPTFPKTNVTAREFKAALATYKHQRKKA